MKDNSSRQILIKTMARLLRKQGYAATGFRQITAEGPAPMGSIYFHFPGGKEELAAAAVSHSGAQISAAIEAATTGLPAHQAVGAIARLLAMALESSQFHYGCPIATIVLEVASDSVAIQEVAARSFADWQALVARRLRADGVSSRRAERLAQLVIASLEGGLILARARRDVAPLLEVAASCGELLREHVRQAVRRRRRPSRAR